MILENDDLKKKEYFMSLEEQILNFKFWNKEIFKIFNHEAGTGKSRETQKILGQMAREKDVRVLYVQVFEKDGELDNTVNNINKWAGKKVAERFAQGDKKIKGKRKEAIESSILCITHKMYRQICRGENADLIKERQILIIDEFPDLTERITISIDDITGLWKNFFAHSGVYELGAMVVEKWIEYKKKYNATGNYEMIKVDFTAKEFDKHRAIINKIFSEVKKSKEKEFINKFKQVMGNQCLFYENAFVTVDDSIEFVMLDNNIILDANAGFNHYYKLSAKFILDEKNKYYSYENSTLKHYQVKTSKKDIKEYLDFFSKSLEQIDIESGDKILFITDKDRKEKLEEEINSFYRYYGATLEEICEQLKIEISVDYFGNIIGKNCYRAYNKVVILKTPYYDYLTYTLQYLSLTSDIEKSKESIQVFRNREIEELRKTTVAGCIYQSLKRINRDNSKVSEIYLFCDNQEIVDIVKEQLPAIEYVKDSIMVTKARKYDATNRVENSKFKQRVNMTQQILLEYKNKGVLFIPKGELREKICVNDGGNFAKILNDLKYFFETHGIVNVGQKLIFK
jgi:hypothetical protein